METAVQCCAVSTKVNELGVTRYGYSKEQLSIHQLTVPRPKQRTRHLVLKFEFVSYWTAIRSLKEIYPFNACSFGDIKGLILFLAREVASIALAMEVSMHSSVLYPFNSLSPQELFGSIVRLTRTIPSQLILLGISATTDDSGDSGLGWRGDAIPQGRLLFQSVSTTMSMFREEIKLNGRFSRYLLSLLFI